METVTGLRARGFELDLSPESFGELLRSDTILNDTAALRCRLAEEGYLYIPGFFPRDLIQAARSEFQQRIHAFGGLDPAYPRDEAVSSGKLAAP